MTRRTVESDDQEQSRRRAADEKTPSGVRKVDLTSWMVDELVAYLHEHAKTEAGWLLPTASGRRRTKDNVNRHVVRPALVRGRGGAGRRERHQGGVWADDWADDRRNGVG